MADNLSPPERALYEASHFGRGENTTALAGLFATAHEYHIAAQLLGRIAEKAPHGTGNPQRTALLRLCQALLVSERNALLDRFHRQWNPADLEDPSK